MRGAKSLCLQKNLEISKMDYLDSTREKGSIAAERVPIWLVLSLSTSGLVSIRAICTKQWIADIYRKGVSQHDDVIRTWIEKTICNHLFMSGEFERSTGLDVIVKKEILL